MQKPDIKIISNSEHTFDPPGRCIYCPSTGDPYLHREHIIPKALRGRLVFRKASCAQCGSETHAFEGRVINRLFGGARHVTGIQPTKDASLKMFSKSKSGGPQFDIQYDLDEFSSSDVSPDEHPGGCVGYELPQRAGIMRGEPPSGDDEFVVMGPKVYVPQDFQQRVSALGLAGKSVLIGGNSKQPFMTEDLGRFLAKIAHSYAVAVHGLGSFVPFLTDAIRGIGPMRLSHYIGKIDPRVPLKDDYNHLHVLEDGFIRIGHRQLLVVRVRLLAVDNYPAYEVVVGEKPLPNYYSPN
jgi:hypothetical protein